MPDLVIGRVTSEAVVLRPLRRERPEAEDYDDGNWLVADIAIAVGGFRGSFQAALTCPEFASFRDALRALSTSPKGIAQFRSMEEWIDLDIKGDGLGHFAVSGSATDAPGTGNRLTFSLRCDQTELAPMLRSLDEICREYPVRGLPAV